MDKFWKWMRKHRHVRWDDGELYFADSRLNTNVARKPMLVGYMIQYCKEHQISMLLDNSIYRDRDTVERMHDYLEEIIKEFAP